ncbi:hypothetical protein LXL04_017645 [Taraxacum kok-saghyz]
MEERTRKGLPRTKNISQHPSIIGKTSRRITTHTIPRSIPSHRSTEARRRSDVERDKWNGETTEGMEGQRLQILIAILFIFQVILFRLYEALIQELPL